MAGKKQTVAAPSFKHSLNENYNIVGASTKAASSSKSNVAQNSRLFSNYVRDYIQEQQLGLTGGPGTHYGLEQRSHQDRRAQQQVHGG